MSLAERTVSTSSGRALTQLYKEHAADAFRYALHLTGRRADAEDIVQHVFLQAYRHLESGRELVSPRAWLLTAVKHRAFNLARDRREVPVDAPVVAVESRDVSGDEAAQLADVRGMLWTLPEPQHHAFVLRHWSGLSQNEIADVLETTPSAVESLLGRARSALLRAHDTASDACSQVRGRLLESTELGGTDAAHLGACRSCRQAHDRLTRAANVAGALALVPGTHVAHSIASPRPGLLGPRCDVDRRRGGEARVAPERPRRGDDRSDDNHRRRHDDCEGRAGRQGRGRGCRGDGRGWRRPVGAPRAGRPDSSAHAHVRLGVHPSRYAHHPPRRLSVAGRRLPHAPDDGAAGLRRWQRRSTTSRAESRPPRRTPARAPGSPRRAGAGKPAGAGTGEGNGNGVGAGGRERRVASRRRRRRERERRAASPPEPAAGTGTAAASPPGAGGGTGNTGGNGNGGGKPAGAGGGTGTTGGNGNGGGKPAAPGGGKPS